MTTMNRLFVAATFALLATTVAAQQGGAPPAHPRPTAPGQSRPSTPAPIKAVGTVKDVMIGIVQPSSELLFGAASTAPQKPEEWTAVENGALTLAESANLLMIGGRARDTGAWAKWATALRETSERGLKAARAKDAGAIETTGDQVYETCEGCHKIYLPGAAVN